MTDLQALLDRVEGEIAMTAKPCEICGKPMTKPRNFTRSQWAARRFCSQACHGVSRREVPKEAASEALRRRVKLDPITGCHNWTGNITSDGYAHLTHRGRKVRAHRLAYETWVGQIGPSMHVCHHCDNRRCVNPAHLFLGSNAENTADRNAKGRQARGERAGRARITEADVRAIRASKERTIDLARRLGIGPTAIFNIRHRRSWTHVTD